MNDDRLAIYLNDHLALMVGEIELARRCEASNRRAPLGEFLSRLAVEVAAQKSIVGDILSCMGRPEDPFKNGAAW